MARPIGRIVLVQPMSAHEGMTIDAKFKVGNYVQRVNQPEVPGIVRELRWRTLSRTRDT